MHVEVELEYQESNHFSPFHIRLSYLAIRHSGIKKASFEIILPRSHALSDVIFNSKLSGKAWDNTRDGNILFCFGPHKKCTTGHKNIRTDCLIIVKDFLSPTVDSSIQLPRYAVAFLYTWRFNSSDNCQRTRISKFDKIFPLYAPASRSSEYS